PPCVACVRCTMTSGRLQLAFLTCSRWPESKIIRSGVSPIHQLGGSTFVTAGATGFADCSAGRAEYCANRATTQKPKIVVQRKWQRIIRNKNNEKPGRIDS